MVRTLEVGESPVGDVRFPPTRPVPALLALIAALEARYEVIGPRSSMLDRCTSDRRLTHSPHCLVFDH